MSLSPFPVKADTSVAVSRGTVVLALAAAAMLALLAMVRPVDHDESQYVAAALLAWRGLPYRDFAYLQPPLQPLLLAPVAMLSDIGAGALSYPVLRLVNALLGVATLAGCYLAAQVAGASRPAALAGAGLLAVTDIFLFSVGVARNDALPAALLALAMVLMLRATAGQSSGARAMLAGLLLAAAAAAKISYALPALGYGVWALLDRRHRPGWLLAGALPVVAMAVALALAAFPAFWFDVITFPARAPAQWYLATGRPDKLWMATKLFDLVKFLALGPGLIMALLWRRDPRSGGAARLLDLMIVAGLVAALLPQPTWRQYLLPMLVPLAVRVSLALHFRPPGRAIRIALCVTAGAGIAPSVESIFKAAVSGVPMLQVVRDSSAIADALARSDVSGPVATLSPQFLGAAANRIDPRFAAGPFYFRSNGLMDARDEWAARLVSMRRLGQQFRARPPAAILVGGEGRWSSGDDRLDAVLETHARGHGWTRVPLRSDRFRLYLSQRTGQ